MARGGRRFGSGAARHPDGEAPSKATRPPQPPEGLPEAEHQAWVELRSQIARARTYNPSRYTAFRLAVKALAAVDTAPANASLASFKGLLEVASKLVGRFGLDPISCLQAERAPAPRKRDEMDEFE